MGEMTNENAIRWLKDLLKSDFPMEQYQIALEKGIEALEQEPCDDAISREETLTAFADYVGGGMSMNDFEALWDIVTKMPSVNPQPQTGHWIRGIERHFLDTRTNENVEMKEATGKGYHTYINVQCSKCRMITIHDDSILYQYCPHCGARMFKPQERSDKE